MSAIKRLRGAGGGGKGGGAARAAREDPDSLNSRAYARVLDALSEGEIGGWGLPRPMQCIALDSTPVENSDQSLNFRDFDVFYVPGSQDQVYIPGFEAAENIQPVGVRVRATTPWTRRFTDSSLDAVRIDVLFPRLQQQNIRNGDITGTEVRLNILVQSNNGGFVLKVDDTVRGYTPDAYTRTYLIGLAGLEAPWDIRVVRSTPDSTVQSLQNETYVQSYSEITYAKMRYPNTALVGINIDAEQFPSVPTRAYFIKGVIVQVPANYDPITRTYATTGPGTTMGTWDGTFKMAWTNNPAWCWYDMATNKRYGLGNYLTAADVNKWELYAIAQYCDQEVPDGNGGMEPRFSCSLYLQKREEAMQVLTDMATIFRGMLYYANGVLKPIQNRPVPAGSYKLFSPTNVVDGQFIYSGTAQRARHTAAVVSYRDEGNFGKLASIDYQDQDGVLKYGLNALQLNNIGCASRMTARRAAKWAITAEQILKDTTSFRTGLEGFLLEPGEVVQIQDPFKAGAEWSGRLETVSDAELTLDSEVTIEAGKTYYVASVKPDGGAQTLTVLNGPGAATVLSVASMGANAPEGGTEWQLSSDDLKPRLVQVLSVAPADGIQCDVIGLEYRDDLFAHIDDDFALDEPPVSILPGAGMTLPPGEVTLTTNVVTQAGVVRRDLLVSWVPSQDQNLRGYRMSFRSGDGNWESVPESPTASAIVRNIVGGNYEVSVVAVNRFGVLSAASLGSLTTAATAEDMPHAEGLELDGQGDNRNWEQRDMKLAWRLNSPTLAARQALSSGGAQDPYFVSYEVRIFNPATGLIVWRELTADPRFTYTYEKNAEAMRMQDPPALPIPQLDVEIGTINTENIAETPEQIPRGRFTNTDPPAPVNFSVIAAFRSVFLRWQIAQGVADMNRIRVFMSRESVFANAVQLAEIAGDAVSFIDDSTMTQNGAVAGDRLWYWLVAVDTFGNTSAPTAAASVVPGSVEPTDIGDFAKDLSIKFPNTIIPQNDIWSNNSPSTGRVAWPLHEIWHRGVAYSIAGGDTDLEWLYWTVGNTVLTTNASKPTATDGLFTVARNVGGLAGIVWRNSPNLVIGSANIDRLAVIDAHIASVSADKIVANSILSVLIQIATGGAIKSDDYAAGVNGFFLSRAYLEVQKLITRDPLTIFSVPTPSITPSQSFSTSLDLYKSTPSGTTVHYTLNGTYPEKIPTTAWPTASGGKLTVDKNVFLRAVAYEDGGQGYSREFLGLYTLVGFGASAAKAATPTIRRVSGWWHHETIHVDFSCVTPSSSIYYSVNGAAYALYTSGTVAVPFNGYVNAYATASGLANSDIASLGNEDYGL